MDLKEGSRINVPCRHCTALTLRVTVRPGVQSYSCGKCRRPTQVTVERSGGRWSVYTARLEPVDVAQDGSISSMQSR